MNLKRIAVVSIGINLAFLFLYASKRLQHPHAPAGPLDQLAYCDMWNQTREKVLERLPIDTGDNVFVGNSIVEGFPLEELFHSTRFKNRGIAGNHSYHIRDRIGRIAAAHPRAIFLDVGINDILHDLPTDALKSNYRAIIATIRRLSPQTMIVAQTVLPVGRERRDKIPAICSFNIWLAGYCDSAHVNFLNLFPLFLKGTQLDPELTVDGVHITGRGYEIWMEAIRPYL
ncbi:MAG TPA: GDSL-type esterase/lipase family protein [Puia sp.]|jgi:lysophospholipase L1-like esterase|nr:GDSL-type esterase/lipase family protein [Puia sp.]